MAEYIDREELVRQIICSMGEFIGAPNDVQKHDEQCDYAINVIEDAIVADVAPVVHGRWAVRFDGPYKRRRCYCSHCGKHNGVGGIAQNQEKPYCPNCGAKMDGGADR